METSTTHARLKLLAELGEVGLSRLGKLAGLGQATLGQAIREGNVPDLSTLKAVAELGGDHRAQWLAWLLGVSDEGPTGEEVRGALSQRQAVAGAA